MTTLIKILTFHANILQFLVLTFEGVVNLERD